MIYLERLESSKFSFARGYLFFSFDSIVCRCPSACERASAIQIPEYPFDAPISKMVLYFRSLINRFKNFPVSGEMLK